ncbi:MAG: NAD(P)/FAD-dependent oxidoreductase [Desulfovibrionaceae bacterium]
MEVKYLIIGAGPTGLGAGRRLAELGERSFLILEAQDHAGGLSSSRVDEAGFTWDLGGHVVFSHYDYFDRMVEEMLADEFLTHQRESWVFASGCWVPYPFQNNIRHLPRKLAWECVRGLLPNHRHDLKPSNFREWIMACFGPGVAKLFMLPYNFKVWATPPEFMAFQWIGERVSVVDLERVLENLVLERDDVSWGPNNTFRFPLHGGTGRIYSRLAETLAGNIQYGQACARIDAETKTAYTDAGLAVRYDKLLNTGPLDILVRGLLDNAPDSLVNASCDLAHNSVHVTGLGVDGVQPDTRCWMYFPDGDSPFYRVTNFHNYSPNNTPAPGEQRAFMCETSSSEHKPEDPGAVMDASIRGLQGAGLMLPGDEGRIASRFQIDLEYGYPVPTLGRDAALRRIQPWLEQRDIYSRGRFGGFKYEVANMDHSVMQGVEWAERMVQGKPETTYTLKEPQ